MGRKIYFALALILIGVFLLLKNFDLLYFNWRLLMYILGIIWGMDLITRYFSEKKAGQLFWGLSIFFNSLWLISANLFYNYITVEELTSTMVAIVAISLILTALISRYYLATLAAIPLILFAFLILNNLYLWYGDIYVDNYVNAGLGSALVSLGLFYMTSGKKAKAKHDENEPSFHN